MFVHSIALGYSDETVAKHASTNDIQHSTRGLCEPSALSIRKTSISNVIMVIVASLDY